MSNKVGFFGFFQRAACAEAALLIPTSSGTIAADKTETYCGTYLSSLEGETLAGEIIGNFAFPSFFDGRFLLF
jgi:hypothetical protein